MVYGAPVVAKETPRARRGAVSGNPRAILGAAPKLFPEGVRGLRLFSMAAKNGNGGKGQGE